jgi:hypothetical protein
VATGSGVRGLLFFPQAGKNKSIEMQVKQIQRKFGFVLNTDY